VTFRHHLFQPAKIPSKATFQPRLVDSDTDSALAFDFKSPTPLTPTFNITATGEILSSPPSQLPSSHSQPSHSSELCVTPLNDYSPSPSTTSSHTTLSSKNTLSQEEENMSLMETSPVHQFCPGYEKGYDNSPMSRLLQEYQQERDEETSTQQRATSLFAKKTLLARVLIYLDNSDAKIVLVNSLLMEITQVVGELQIFLERTSGLIPERRSYFKVDPRGTFLSVLSGAMDLPQLHAAWYGLNKRIGLAQESLGKYEAQYRQPCEPSNFSVPTSPISTDPKIYEAMSDLGELDAKMRYLYQSVPHLQEEVPSPRRLTDRSSWEHSIPLPENLAELHRNESNIISLENHKKGKERSHGNDESLPPSPRMLNVGYGTPFHSSSQFFDKPD